MGKYNLKTINGYHIDDNDNKWDANIYTIKQAEKYSKTLTNCVNCSNCSYCSNCSCCSGCSGCSNCSYCSNCSCCSGCSGCSNCSYCSYCSCCSGCSGCSSCSYCSDCSDCSGCSSCSYCSDCSDCSNCSGFKSNPQIYRTGNIGSRIAPTVFYWNNEKNKIICGCFSGDIIEFEAKVNGSYPDEDNEYRIQYMGEIQKFKMLAGLP
jgi:hypothetical protein